MRAVIEMEGGLIKNITSDEALEVLVIDRDMSDDGIAEDFITLDGKEVFVQIRDAEENETLVEDLFCRSISGEEIPEANEEED